MLHREYGEPLAEHLWFSDNEWWVELDNGDLRKATPSEVQILTLTNELADMEPEEIEVPPPAAWYRVQPGCPYLQRII